jgi:hypothetical protein
LTAARHSSKSKRPPPSSGRNTSCTRNRDWRVPGSSQRNF